MQRFALFALLLSLSACAADNKRDYESSRRCHDRGITAESPDFEQCVKEERSLRMMEQQRREFEERKQMDEYYRNRRL